MSAGVNWNLLKIAKKDVEDETEVSTQAVRDYHVLMTPAYDHRVAALKWNRRHRPLSYYVDPFLGGILSEIYNNMMLRYHASLSDSSRWRQIFSYPLNPFSWVTGIPYAMIDGNEEKQKKVLEKYRKDYEKHLDEIPEGNPFLLDAEKIQKNDSSAKNSGFKKSAKKSSSIDESELTGREVDRISEAEIERQYAKATKYLFEHYPLNTSMNPLLPDLQDYQRSRIAAQVAQAQALSPTATYLGPLLTLGSGVGGWLAGSYARDTWGFPSFSPIFLGVNSMILSDILQSLALTNFSEFRKRREAVDKAVKFYRKG